MANRIEGEAKGAELDKRTYLPGIKVFSTCPKGGEEHVKNMEHDYLSYPTVGEEETINFWCEDHDEEWSVFVVLDLTLRLANG